MNALQMMACGHVENAVEHLADGTTRPACAICAGIDPRAKQVVERPSLEGRQARCGSCKTTTPSDWELAFFEFRGEGSRQAKESCQNCGYSIVAHTAEVRARGVKVCDEFHARGAWEFDGFYCGCQGWD